MKKIFIAFLFTVFISNINAQTKKIPFEIAEGFHLMIVKATINGYGPYNFIFDTGAGGATLSKEVIEDLKIKGCKFPVVDSARLASPIDTLGITAYVVNIDKLKIGNINFENFKIIEENMFQIPGLKIDGVIGGFDFDENLVEVNYNTKEITLSDNELPKKKSIQGKFMGLIEINIIANNKKLPAHLDSGSPNFISFPYEMKNDFEYIKEPEFFTKARIMNNEIDIYKAQIKGIIKIGDITIENPEIELTTGGFQVVNIGYNFMKDKVISFDKKNIRISIKEN